MHRLLLVLPILAAAAPVYADPCRDARAELKAKDLARAWIDAQACGDETLIADVAARVEKAGYSPVEVVTDPDGGTVVVEPAPDRPFTAPMRVWLPPGRHYVTAMVDGVPVAQTVAVAKNGNRASALLSLPPPVDPAKTGVVDMGEEGGGEMSSGPPPKVVMPSLLPDRYQRGVDARDGKDPWLATRGGRRWALVAGLAVSSPSSAGATLALEHRVGSGPWSLAPTVAVSFLRGDEYFAQGHAAAMVMYGAGRAAIGLGPSVVVTRGSMDVDGVSFGALLEIQLELIRGLIAAVRVDVPALTSADRRVLDGALLAGRRW